MKILGTPSTCLAYFQRNLSCPPPLSRGQARCLDTTTGENVRRSTCERATIFRGEQPFAHAVVSDLWMDMGDSSGKGTFPTQPIGGKTDARNDKS